MIQELPQARRHAAGLAALKASHACGVLRTAMLTLALSLPQGLLALPIAVAQVGVVPGMLTILLFGALNTITVAWAAREVAASGARHGVVPSLTQLAYERLGPRGGLLTLGSGAALFFLALLASVVGLARSLAELTGAPAPVWGLGCGLGILTLVLRRASLGSRLLIGLGLLNVGLLVALLLLMLPHLGPMAATAPAGGSPLAMAGVSLMLFFAPMLVAPVASHVLPQGYAPRTLVWGSAAGVAGGAALFGLWAAGVCSVVGAANLAGATGTAVPALLAALPQARLPGLLLGLVLLGMTALRCALVLGSLGDERLPRSMCGLRRRLCAQLPTCLSLALALGCLSAGATSFTQLVAVAGIATASLTSLVVPAMLRRQSAVS